ncbi:MAG: hypothetical protein R3A13_09725 [Bdellovibrionota bacterium]
MPQRVEDLNAAAALVIEAVEKDGHWGQFAIIVEAVMLEKGMINKSLELDSETAAA